jgi:carbon catabolite-derepressing protein kinase
MSRHSFTKSAVSHFCLLPYDNLEELKPHYNLPEGTYHVPSYLSQDARSLLHGMLAVDPVKRITVTEITQHAFFKTDLPRYLTPLPPRPGPMLPTLSALVAPPPKALDFELIEGLGRIEEDVVEELATRMQGVEPKDIWEALRRDDGIQGNAVRVAYLLLRDKHRLGRDCKWIYLLVSFPFPSSHKFYVVAEFEEQERDALLASMDVRS